MFAWTLCKSCLRPADVGHNGDLRPVDHALAVLRNASNTQKCPNLPHKHSSLGTLLSNIWALRLLTLRSCRSRLLTKFVEPSSVCVLRSDTADYPRGPDCRGFFLLCRGTMAVVSRFNHVFRLAAAQRRRVALKRAAPSHVRGIQDGILTGVGCLIETGWCTWSCRGRSSVYDEKSNADLWWSGVKGRLTRAEPQSGCHQSAGRLDFCWPNGERGGSWRTCAL